MAPSSSSPREGARDFNVDLTENQNRLRASGFLYKLLPFFDGPCHTSLATFFLSSTVLEFIHDEASGFDRHCTGSAW